MTIKEQRLAFAKMLTPHYPTTEIDSFYHLLLEHLLGFTRFEVHQKGDLHLNKSHLLKISEAIKRLIKFEPIQYIIGATKFYGLPFLVNEHTLIPRPETEELVQWILDDQKDKPLSSKILDIGTGSGCIAIALAHKLPDTVVNAIDVSQQALKVAQENAINNKVAVNFAHQDILMTVALDDAYDVIVSNPPYVRFLEKKEMQKRMKKLQSR